MINEFEKTVVLVKPDGLQRGLVGEIVHRFERKGLKLVGLKMMTLEETVLDEWYSHLRDKAFFKDLKSYLRSTPIVAMAWEGLECIAAVRKIVGITKSREAEAGSIRGDFGMSKSQNMIHASDSVESARKELSLVFASHELFEYSSGMDCLIYSEDDRS